MTFKGEPSASWSPFVATKPNGIRKIRKFLNFGYVLPSTET